jgi:hypothetical protein
MLPLTYMTISFPGAHDVLRAHHNGTPSATVGFPLWVQGLCILRGVGPWGRVAGPVAPYYTVGEIGEVPPVSDAGGGR